LAWGLEGDPEVGARLGAALWLFWRQRGHHGEGRHWLDRILARATGATPARGGVLTGAGLFAQDHGDYARAIALLEEAERHFRAIDDRPGNKEALRFLAACLLELGDVRRAESAAVESLDHARSLEDERGIGSALRLLGLLAAVRGDPERAEALLEEALPHARRAVDAWSTALALGYLGSLALNREDLPAARRRLGECERMARAHGDIRVIGTALLELARLEHASGDERRARTLLADSLPLLQVWGGRTLRDALNHLGELEIRRGEHDRGVRLVAAAATHPCSVNGNGWVLLLPTGDADRETGLVQARSALGDAPCADAWAEGQAMTLEQVVTYALGGPDGAGPG
jgi:tetratricopeptide (TPR) repeat protein